MAELENLRQNRMYLAIMALLLVCAIIWVLLTVMEAGDSSEVTALALKHATPLNPNLDVAVFGQLEQKRLFSESELESFPIFRLIKDRNGSYSVVPFDTPADELERLTSGTRTTAPARTPAPTATATPAPRATAPTPTPVPVSPTGQNE